MDEARSMVVQDIIVLVEAFKRLGFQAQSGLQVTFADLLSDEILQQNIESLFGTLKAARRRNVIHFEGEILLQGKNDADLISLLIEPEDVHLFLDTDKEPFDNTFVDSDAALARDRCSDADLALSQDNVENVSSNAGRSEATPSLGPKQGSWNVDTSTYIDARTMDPDRISARQGLSKESPRHLAASQKDASGNWTVDTSHIHHRTLDPNRTRGRQGVEPVDALASNTLSTTATKNVEGKWEVDTSYVNHRTMDVENIEARKLAHLTREDTAELYAKSQKTADGKWKVDMSYIESRTESPNRLEARKQEEMKALSPTHAGMSRKGVDGKWHVDTTYVNMRTESPDRLEARRNMPASVPVAAASRKDVTGSWKVDTSYVGVRTKDPDNIRRLEETTSMTTKAKNYDDPSVTKYELFVLNEPGACPSNVNPSHKEAYLHDEVFTQIFGMSRTEFLGIPKWKQQKLKKELNLF